MKKIITIIVLAAALFTMAANAQEQTAPKKVYNEDIDPMEQIDQAIAQAQTEGKFVICQVGGNWCPWCLRFAEFITNDSTINSVIEQNFVYVHVNYHPRKAGEMGEALMKRFNNAGRFGFPVFVVLDGQGNILHIQDSSFLEEGQGYNKEKTLRFFQNWTPAAVNEEKSKTSIVMDNEILKALRERRSVRQFKSEQITYEELQAVLDAGTFAPTAMGRQDPWIVAVQNPEIVAQLVRMNAEVLGMDGNPYYGAPTIVLVFASRSDKSTTPVNDGSLVLGNMMNAAHAIGLGSCWIHREREMFDTEEGKALMRQFGLPEGLIGIGSIALGYPAAAPQSPKARKEGYYRIVK
jgi:nitroreductase/thioredoxin-related protein